MKIFISADMEGTNGIVSPEEVIPGESGYESGRILMTEEVNAAVDGAFLGGATEVTVCDSHEVSRNIRFDLLDKRAGLIKGCTRRDSMVHGIDNTYGGLILLGHHAKFGTEGAVLDHTYDQYLVRDISINGLSCGEVAINGMLAAERGVPLIMVSGDDALEREVKNLSEDVRVAKVKHGMGRFCANCLPREESLTIIRNTAKLAVEEADMAKCLNVPENPQMVITFQQVNMADGAVRVTGTERLDPFTISYRCDSMDQVMAMRQVITQAALEFYSNKF